MDNVSHSCFQTATTSRMDELNNDFSDLLSRDRNTGASSVYVESNMDDDFSSNPFADLQGNPSSVWASPADFEQAAAASPVQEVTPGSPLRRRSHSSQSEEAEDEQQQQQQQQQPAREVDAPAGPASPHAGSDNKSEVTSPSEPQAKEDLTIHRTPTPASTSYSAMVSPSLPSSVEQEPPYQSDDTSRSSPALEHTLEATPVPSTRDNASLRSTETVPLSQEASEASSWHSEQTANAIHHSSRPTTPTSEPEPTSPIQSTTSGPQPASLPPASDSFTPLAASVSTPLDGRPASDTEISNSHPSDHLQPAAPPPPPEADRPNYLITVTDPQKIGSDVTGSSHILYTVRSVSSVEPSTTRSVLRRFNDFLWLYDTLCANNPGCIIPPPPEKHALGRFSGDFVEQRRKSLQVFLGKVAAHPMLWSDHDFRMFLTSDTFALDIRHRPAPTTPATPSFSLSGLLSSGPKFIEPSEFIASKQATLAALEPSLRSLTASLQSASKARANVANSLEELCEAVGALEQCGLSTPAKRTLAGLKDLHEQLASTQRHLSLTAESDLVAMFDSWIRLASTSVKHALNARLKLWQTWQKQLAALKSVERKRESQGDTWQAEHRDAEMRAEQARREFEDSTKLVGAELIRFEVEKGEDFRLALGAYVDALYKAQTEIVAGWEKYHKLVLENSSSNSSPSTPQQPSHPKEVTSHEAQEA